MGYYYLNCMLPLHSPHQRDRLGSTDSRVLDGEDLLDDVLTAPATAPSRSMGHTPTNEDEVRAHLFQVTSESVTDCMGFR